LIVGTVGDMPLRFEPDVSAADWLVQSTAPWNQVCSIGPDGFAGYARVFHVSRELQDADVQSVEGDLDPARFARLIDALAPRTTTANDCLCALWDGFGELYGGEAVVSFLGLDSGPRQVAQPAFPQAVMSGPRVELPHRRYLLFRGSLDQAGDWGAREVIPGYSTGINSPNLMWPADRAWFVATEIDMPWTGVAGSAELIADLVATPGLDVEVVAAGADLAQLPYWTG
jgi:hypothetical protein